jgi:excisionase family DNA binding protein
MGISSCRTAHRDDSAKAQHVVSGRHGRPVSWSERQSHSSGEMGSAKWEVMVEHMQPRDDDALLTPSEVAAMFRVNPKTVTRWARAGKISAIRTLGGHRRFRESEIRQFLEQVEQTDQI